MTVISKTIDFLHRFFVWTVHFKQVHSGSPLSISPFLDRRHFITLAIFAILRMENFHLNTAETAFHLSGTVVTLLSNG